MKKKTHTVVIHSSNHHDCSRLLFASEEFFLSLEVPLKALFGVRHIREIDGRDDTLKVTPDSPEEMR